MNSQSAHTAPAHEWNVDSIGPTATCPRKPSVGEPPSTQPFPDAVA